MYKDDSLTLHTDLYQINMMQVYFNKVFTIKRPFSKFISVNFRLKMALLCSQVWNVLSTILKI